jgi:hypothetical protein
MMHALLIAPFETLGFMRAALVACAALALANGAVGTLLVLRRTSLAGDVLGHAVMPGRRSGTLGGRPPGGYRWAGSPRPCGGGAGGARRRPACARRCRAGGILPRGAVARVVLITWRGSNADAMRVLFGTVLAIDHRALIQIAAISSVILLAVAALYAGRSRSLPSIQRSCARCARCCPTRRCSWSLCWRWWQLPGVRHAAGARADAAAGRGCVPVAVGSPHRSRWQSCSGSRHRWRGC